MKSKLLIWFIVIFVDINRFVGYIHYFKENNLKRVLRNVTETNQF